MLVIMSEALKQYYEDNVVATAVEALANRKPVVPVTLEWKDMDDFYQAVGAAHHVKVEYARFLHNLWNQVWGVSIDPASLSKPANTADSNQILVDECWSEGSYGRCLADSRRENWLWLNVDSSRSMISFMLSVTSLPASELLNLLDREAGWRVHDAEWVSLDGGDPLSIDERLPVLAKAVGDAVSELQTLRR